MKVGKVRPYSQRKKRYENHMIRNMHKGNQKRSQNKFASWSWSIKYQYRQKFATSAKTCCRECLATVI